MLVKEAIKAFREQKRVKHIFGRDETKYKCISALTYRLNNGRAELRLELQSDNPRVIRSNVRPRYVHLDNETQEQKN